MNFKELEAKEGLRWTWNAWPRSPREAESLVVPLSILCSPMALGPDDYGHIPRDPLLCRRCGAALNPYARVDYRAGLWACLFCSCEHRFTSSDAGIGEYNVPTVLKPTYSTVEYRLSRNSSRNPILRDDASTSSSSLQSDETQEPGPAEPGPALVFVVDLCTDEEELQSLQKWILYVFDGLPDNIVVGLISFESVVRVHCLECYEFPKTLLFSGHREFSSKVVQQRIFNHCKLGLNQTTENQVFLLPVSDCRFSFTERIEELKSTPNPSASHRPVRATGAAISIAIALLEGHSPNVGGRVIVFTSGAATIGPGMIVETDLSKAIRTHQDIVNGHAPFTEKARRFYKQLAQRLSHGSFVLDLFACSLDQTGIAELRHPVETSGGFLVLAYSFRSEQFIECLWSIYKPSLTDYIDMNFDATIKIITTKEVKICGALGPCTSLQKKNNSVSKKKIGHGGTYMWQMSTLTSKTCIAFFFQVSTVHNFEQPPVFFVQFMTRYRKENGEYLRVTTVSRIWANIAPELTAGFDQEAAAAVMARLAIERAEEHQARDIIRWLDKMLIRFIVKFGDYRPKSSLPFWLAPNFSLFPQFMYHLQRSQFIDVSNTTPDETAFFRIMLNQEGVAPSCKMIQPTLLQCSVDQPLLVPVVLDVSSLCPDVILLFDSYFHIVIHQGLEIASRRRLGYDNDPNYGDLRNLLEALDVHVKALMTDRIPTPKLIRCDEQGSEARFLLARLDPMALDVVKTDDVSLRVFLENLQESAVRGRRSLVRRFLGWLLGRIPFLASRK